MSGAFVPEGSYKNSSQDISVVLNCEAQKRDQSWTHSSFDLTNSPGDVALENIDGELKKAGGTGTRSGFIPGGSYSQTCRNVTVRVYSKSKRRDQSLIAASYDLTKASPDQTSLENIDGVLVQAGS